MINPEILERALDRQKKARILAEQILETKSLELYEATQELKEVNQKLETLLTEKNSQLKGVFENINDAYLVMDIEGNALKMNEVAENLFEYSLDKEHLNITDLIYKEDYVYAINSFNELLEKGSFYDYTARVVTKNKKIKWVHINASLIYDESNKAIAAQGIIRDITEKREERLTLDLINNTVKSILGKENIYEIAWEISSSIAKYLGTDDCVIYLFDKNSNSFEQIAAFKKNVTEKNNLLKKITLNLEESIVGTVAKTGLSEIVNDTSIDKRYIIDDEVRLSEITVPIISNGTVIGIIDSEYKEKNHFTKEHVKTIENIANLVVFQLKSAINLRERKIAETKNAELLKKLEKSNEELQEYAHIVSHDLKSPLRSIAALTSWIKTDNIDAFDEASLQYFEDIDLTLETMENLISDVLKYSSLDANVSEDELVNIHQLIDNLIHVLYVPSNISINILKPLPTLKGDKIKFQQLFQNLISNAVKFNNKEKGIINIDVEDCNSFYKFSVSDNGIGIEEKHFEKIFKIFQSLKKAKSSSGIGLSIVKKIVDIYNGEVWVESEIEIGTTFYFTIKK